MNNLVAGLLLTATAFSFAAQNSPPETPATEKLALWLEALNSGDRKTQQRFVRQHWPSRPNQDVDWDLDFRARTGGLDLLRIEEASAARAVALVAERDSDTVARLTLEVDVAEPHHITGFGCTCDSTPS